jgi:GNAT superfamily N-acetyltransferase
MDTATAPRLTAEIKLLLPGGKTAVLRYTEAAGAFSLDIMLVPSAFRGRGLGTLLLQRLLLLADALGMPVFTTARPLGGGNQPGALERLVAYYARFGFEPVKRGLTTVHMCRPAAPTAALPSVSTESVT